MTKTKSTKHALVMSVMALFLCFTMLLGTTFAWFTDSVTSANNIIKSGTLDVEMHYAKGTENPENATWNDASQTAIFNYDKWEPGYVDVKHIQISNVGTLALKYQIKIVANGEVSDLADVIDVYYVDPAKAITDSSMLTSDYYLGNLTKVLSELDTTASGKLVAGAKDTVTIALKMREDAGNAYQNKSIGADFSIILLATQATDEYDSFDDQYDADAPKLYSVNGVMYDTVEAALDAAKDGDKVILSSFTTPIVVDKAIELTISNTNIVAGDGENGITVNADATIIADGYNSVKGGKDGDGINVAEGVTLTLGGNGSLYVSGNTEKEYFSTTGKDANGNGSVTYGETISNTTDESFNNTCGSGIYVAGDLVIDGLKGGLVAKGYGVLSDQSNCGFGIGGPTDSIVIKNSKINYVRAAYPGVEMFIHDWAGHFYGKKEPTSGPAIGSSVDGAVIEITSSTISMAEGGSKGAGIGARYHTGITVNITDSTVTAIGGNASAGIGGSRVDQNATETDAITVNIVRSTVTATGGDYAAGIGSGYNTHADKMANSPVTTVTIDEGSNVTATGGCLGAGIGTGHNVLNFVGDIKCDTTNVKAGNNVDDCCHGALCSDVNDIGLGAYKIEALYTKITNGLYQDKNDANVFYVYGADGLQSLHDWYTDPTNASYNMRKAFWGKTYNIMTDIDATDMTWTTVKTGMDSATSNGIIFNGNGHTISNLTMEGNGMFTGATQGNMEGTAITVIQDLTLDNATVTGGTHHNGAIWGEVVGSITLDNVHVINSKVSGGCNVGGLVGRNSEEPANVTFKNCSVKNTTVEATEAADFAGASAFLGNALHVNGGTKINLAFEGNNVAEGNTLTTATGMQGGGIYTTADWGTASWETPVVVDNFENYNSAAGKYVVEGVSVMLSEEAYASIVYHDKDGWENKVKSITVYTAQDLASALTLRQEGVFVHNGTNDIHPELHFGADIDFGGKDFTGFGNQLYIYGHGKTLSNINFVGTDAVNGKAGLIAYAGNNKIDSLTIKDATVAGCQAGIFCGNADNVQITNCALEGNITINWQQYIGATYTETYNGVGAAIGVYAGGANNTLGVDTTDATIVINNDGITYEAGKTAEADTLVGVVYGGSYTKN